MARRLFSSTLRGSFGGVGMSGSQFTGLVSVATVVATRLKSLDLMDILGIHGKRKSRARFNCRLICNSGSPVRIRPSAPRFPNTNLAIICTSNV